MVEDEEFIAEWEKKLRELDPIELVKVTQIIERLWEEIDEEYDNFRTHEIGSSAQV